MHCRLPFFAEGKSAIALSSAPPPSSHPFLSLAGAVESAISAASRARQLQNSVNTTCPRGRGRAGGEQVVPAEGAGDDQQWLHCVRRDMCGSGCLPLIKLTSAKVSVCAARLFDTPPPDVEPHLTLPPVTQPRVRSWEDRKLQLL